MEGSVQGKFDTFLVKKIVKALKEVRPTFKRELLASRRRKSMPNLRQCAENLATFLYSNQVYNGGS